MKMGMTAAGCGVGVGRGSKDLEMFRVWGGGGYNNHVRWWWWGHNVSQCSCLLSSRCLHYSTDKPNLR